jgi:hypothetical protein
MKPHQGGEKDAPTASDGVYRLFGSNKEAYLRYWEARMGAEAAEKRWNAARFRVFAQLPEILWFPAIVVGVWGRWAALVAVGILLAGFSVVACMLMFLARHRMYVHASRHLGRKLNWRNGWRKLPVQGNPTRSPANPPSR